ncbi:unnamed protein product [Leuciscus chuanchicus]
MSSDGDDRPNEEQRVAKHDKQVISPVLQSHDRAVSDRAEPENLNRLSGIQCE